MLGSVRAITDETGAVVIRHDYRPFGEDTQPLTGDPNRFAGKQLDAETGQHYFDARYYRNTWGRFTTVDPLHVGAAMTDPQQWNRYACARGNPLRFVDPTGLAVDSKDPFDLPKGGTFATGTFPCEHGGAFPFCNSAITNEFLGGGPTNCISLGCEWDVENIPGAGSITAELAARIAGRPQQTKTTQTNTTDDNTDDGTTGGGGGPNGGSGTATGACSLLPDGFVLGGSGGLGALGGATFYFDIVVDFRSATTSFYASGSLRIGWQHGASAGLTTGLIWGSYVDLRPGATASAGGLAFEGAVGPGAGSARIGVGIGVPSLKARFGRYELSGTAPLPANPLFTAPYIPMGPEGPFVTSMIAAHKDCGS